MNILINILVGIICLAVGYFFGSFEISLVIGKFIFHQDPRQYGSHNSGGTNCGRLWGKRWGLFIIICDFIKTLIPIYLCWALLTFIPFDNGKALLPNAYHLFKGNVSDYCIKWPIYWIGAFGAMIGHCFPCFSHFKGGKGAANYMGITITTSWFGFLFGGFVYLVTLKKSKYVSLSAILTAVFMTICTWVWAILQILHIIPEQFYWFPLFAPILCCNYVYAIVITIMGALMTIRHHENIDRLKAGTERKIKWMK